MRVLVAGSEGNVGRLLVRHLASRGHEVLRTDIKPGNGPGYVVADINSPADLLPAFDWNPDVVFGLSGEAGRVVCENSPYMSISTNVAGINNLAQLCKRYRARLVFMSTSEVYGPGCDPMDEDRSELRPNNRYGLSKLLAEKLVEYEASSCGLDAVILRLFMLYHEDESFGDHRSAMIRFAWNLAMGRRITVHSGSMRGWMHGSDGVRAMEAAMQVPGFSVINIGSPDVRSMEYLARAVCRELGAQEDMIDYEDIPPRMTLMKRPVLEKQSSLLGITPRVYLDDGVRRVCTRVRERISHGEEWS